MFFVCENIGQIRKFECNFKDVSKKYIWHGNNSLFRPHKNTPKSLNKKKNIVEKLCPLQNKIRAPLFCVRLLLYHPSYRADVVDSCRSSFPKQRSTCSLIWNWIFSSKKMKSWLFFSSILSRREERRWTENFFNQKFFLLSLAMVILRKKK